MGALKFLQSRGLNAVSLPSGKVRVRPAGLLNDYLRQWIRDHKSELLDELKQQESMHRAWRLRIDDFSLTMISLEPCTQEDALRFAQNKFGDKRVKEVQPYRAESKTKIQTPI